MKEIPQAFLNRVYSELAFKGYRLGIENEENLEPLNNRQIPIVVYFNHLVGDDPVIVFALINKITKGERQLLLPVSDEYTSLRVFPLYAIGVLGARHLLGWQMPEITQSYRLRDERLSEEQRSVMVDNAGRLALELFRKIKTELQQKEKPVIVISPEGHRSEQGLLPAEAGIGLLVKSIKEKKGLVLPLGLVYQGNTKRGLNFNPFNPLPVDIIVGRAVDDDEILRMGEELYQSYELPFSGRNEEVAHTLMWYLAQLLPEELHGYYHSSYIKETLMGRRRLGINKEGRVEVRE